MKLSASIPGRRKNSPISVIVSAEDDLLSLTIPSVDRAASATFEVEIQALREALDLLAPPQTERQPPSREGGRES